MVQMVCPAPVSSHGMHSFLWLHHPGQLRVLTISTRSGLQELYGIPVWERQNKQHMGFLCAGGSALLVDDCCDASAPFCFCGQCATQDTVDDAGAYCDDHGTGDCCEGDVGNDGDEGDEGNEGGAEEGACSSPVLLLRVSKQCAVFVSEG